MWTLIYCPKGVRPIGTKWVLKNKKDERGNVIRNKARLVAQGHTQEEGINYDELFAPVARIEAIRLFLAYASFMGFIVYQMDVKSAFFYGTIDEEVKQREEFILVQVYMDDIIFGSSNPQLCREFKALMHEKFQMSAMGELNFFLGLQVLQKKDGIFLSQDKYVGDILKKFRPDIMFAVCACARHQVTPKECHLYAVKRRYLNSHPKLGLWYSKESPFDLVAYSDSDYVGATQDRKSTTGGCQFLGIRLILLQCKKQTIVATSTTKAEYVAAASCRRQVLWVQNQLLDYGLSMPCETLSREFSTSILHFNTIMARLQFCDYHNMVAILEKSEHNINFYPMVDFIEASPLRIETTEEGTQILTTVDVIYRTVTESSLRRNLKLKDEEGISSLPDTELFENLTLMGYTISPNQKFTFQKGRFSHQWKIVPLFYTMLVQQGEGTCTPTEPQHTPSPKVQSPSHTTHTSPTLPPITTTFIPTITLSDTPIVRQYTRRTRIAQSFAPPTVADEPESPLRYVSQGEAYPTDSGFIADQDSATIAKSSTLPYDSASRVTSPAAAEGIFATATVVTPYKRRKGKKVMIKSKTPKKQNVQEQIDAQVARELEEQLEREDQRRSEQITRNAEIARIHAKEELQIMIDGLDRNNETIAKYLSNLGWKVKDFRGMTFEEVEAKFNSVWKQMEDFIPMGSKEEAERIKRKGLNLEQESAKKQKTLEEVPEEVKSHEEVPEEKVYHKGQRSYWKITRLGGSSASYQFFIDLLKHLDREDLNQLWRLVKETLSNRPPSSDKEMEFWVELNRLYEPDDEDQLWTHT
nr:hypothetical protein [Tanacetum cinerariifolium]